MIKLQENKDNKILICVVDRINTYSNGYAREIAKNLSDYFIGRFLRDHNVYIGSDEDELLREAAKPRWINNYTHCVMIASGTSFNTSDKFLDLIDNFCNNNEFFVAGHILDREHHYYFSNGYYELHHQFYIVNLREYTEIGCPSVGQQEFVEHTQIEPIRSTDLLYNDKEVCSWLKPGTIPKTYSKKLHGYNIISEGLKHNKVFMDLGIELRNCKYYPYYEYEHVFLRSIDKLHSFNFYGHSFVNPLNSELLVLNLSINKPIEQYITVGTGLNWIKQLIHLNYNTDTTVIFTDINPLCLQFMRSLVTEWDGNNFMQFYRNIYQSGEYFVPNNMFETYGKSDIIPDEPYWYISSEDIISSIIDWPTVWNSIKKLSYKFILIDYTSSYNLNWIDPNLVTVMNISDVFVHIPFAVTQSMKYRISCENKLIEKLREINPDITLMFSARAADQYYINYTNIKNSGKVSELILTTDDNLKSLPWH
jgi:hypothetical protein